MSGGFGPKLIACTYPGCPAIVAGASVCAEHRVSAKTTARGYGSAWRRAAKEWLKAHPWCKRCGARAVLVDHIIPIRGFGVDPMDSANWRSLCHRCHGDVTRGTINPWRRRYGPLPPHAAT